jgi:hypothetical protein
MNKYVVIALAAMISVAAVGSVAKGLDYIALKIGQEKLSASVVAQANETVVERKPATFDYKFDDKVYKIKNDRKTCYDEMAKILLKSGKFNLIGIWESEKVERFLKEQGVKAKGLELWWPKEQNYGVISYRGEKCLANYRGVRPTFARKIINDMKKLHQKEPSI